MMASERVATAMRERLERSAEATPFLEGWPDLRSVRPQEPRLLPVCRWLPDAVALAGADLGHLVALVAEEANQLEWRQTYSAGDFGADFLDRYGWTELIGQRGPIPSESVAAGVLLLGPEVEYPSHSHEAVELYLPLAGTALWKRGTGEFRAVAPGEAIRHESWEPHTMRTQSEPLVASYVWRGGDLQAKSRIMGQAAPGPGSHDLSKDKA